MKLAVVLLSSLSLLLASTGCGWSNKAKGGAIGAGAGGVAGSLIGRANGNTALGAIIGAAVGGSAGVLIGNHMDKQAEEMRRDLENARIERVGEGIKITFESGILFDIDSYQLQAEATSNLANLVKILIEGDTDNTGTDAHNQPLSERRAQAVADYQKSLGVAGSRVSTVGLGESNPVASNDSEDGRRQNRRVEVAIFANDALKQAAKNGQVD